MTALLDSFSQALDPLLQRGVRHGAARAQAMDAALQAGLPQARNEAWKYTPLRGLERRRFAAAEPGAFDAALLAGIPAPRLVFNNGRYDAARSDLSGLAAGVSLQPLSQLLAGDDPRVSNFLERKFERVEEVFARVNAALAEDGAVLRVDAGADGGEVHLVFVGVPLDGDRAWHLRNLIELQESARLTVVEHHLGAGEHAHLANQFSHVHLSPSAELTHARVQGEADGATLIARTDAALSRESRYRRLDLELGAALSRHEFNAALHGQGAQLRANGVLLATGKRHLDTRLGIDHVGRDSGCDLLWRGIAAGRSRAAFHGGILIREGADGTAAALSNKNLLLSEQAEIDTQPVLEIHADEVQAAHGATVGQLDANALFYLRSRGVPAEAARALLTAAFGRETLSVFAGSAAYETLAARLDAALAKLESA